MSKSTAMRGTPEAKAHSDKAALDQMALSIPWAAVPKWYVLSVACPNLATSSLLVSLAKGRSKPGNKPMGRHPPS
eukprot:12892059-Prorocentrum_lima.AAC.1